MNELKPDDVMRALEAWIYDFQGKSTQFCALCDAITLLKKYQAENAEKDAEIERLTKRLEKEAKCEYDLCGEIVDLKAEIEMLKAENALYANGVEKIAENYHRQGRAEAITEFAERLISKCDAPHWCVWLSEIEDLVEEMKGETDGNS